MKQRTEISLPAKLRVYELARELGMTNKETLDLCEALGVGVKSHSSSIIEAQADRVRRRAEREGLTRPVQPEEPKKASAKKAAAKKAPAKKAAAAKEAPAEEVATQEAPSTGGPDSTTTADDGADAVTAAPPAEEVDESDASAAPAPAKSSPAPMTGRVISTKPAVPPRPAKPAEVAPPPAPAPKLPSRPSDVPAAKARPTPDPAEGAPQPAPPLSPSGKPVPPPPGPPLSRTGKPIPPPPGSGGRKATAPAGRSSGPGGRGGGSAPAGYRAQRPPGGGAPGGGPPAGGGPPSGRPGGGRGRPGGPQRPQRRKSRRRRSREELQPINVHTYTPEDAAVPRGTTVLERGSTAQVLGPKLNRTAADVVRFLLQNGEMVTATQTLSDELIELFAEEIGASVKLVDVGEEQEVELLKVLDVPEEEEDRGDLPGRPPVITIMGHVDHGKTKLLDRIRSANVVEGEAGGITQHIGAYQAHRGDKLLTFIDTPGHEAFTAMRSRGADATDIVVLVVAADDGVMPQTIEAIQHAKAADVPIVVAVNKIDRENADVNRVLQQLTEYGLVPEAWGGETIVSEISALQEIGIDELLDSILLVSELEDFRASQDGRATGVVLESHLDTGRGPVSTILVQRGMLSVGDPLVAGAAWGRVRALVNDQGEQVKEAGPATPVQVLGLSDIAAAGEGFVVAPDERKAKSVAETREHWQREVKRTRDSGVASGGARLEDIFDQIQTGESATLNLVVKADVHGSLEAVLESLRKLERPEVKIGFVLRGVGGISESDIQLAATSNATIIGFNVRPGRNARELAEVEGVEIRTYEIIYKLLEDIEAALVGMLAPEFEEVVTGDAEVREVFRVPKIGAVAGCMVTNGAIGRGSSVRFLRDGTVIWKGEITSLRRFKDDVKEVASGFECGIGLSDFQDLKPGDVIETFDLKEIPRT